jgi:hypothetical protein
MVCFCFRFGRESAVQRLDVGRWTGHRDGKAGEGLENNGGRGEPDLSTECSNRTTSTSTTSRTYLKDWSLGGRHRKQICTGIARPRYCHHYKGDISPTN